RFMLTLPKSYAAMDWNDWAFLHAMYLGMETEDPVPLGNLRARCMILSDSGKGSGASSTRSMTEKMAVLAPIPSARASTATMVKPGFLIRTRREWRTSANRVSIKSYTPGGGAGFPLKSVAFAVRTTDARRAYFHRLCPSAMICRAASEFPQPAISVRLSSRYL